MNFEVVYFSPFSADCRIAISFLTGRQLRHELVGDVRAIGDDLAACAITQLRDLYNSEWQPCFVILAALVINAQEDAASPRLLHLTSSPNLDDLNPLKGQPLVLRQVLAYSANGRKVQTFVRDSPGRLADEIRSEPGVNWIDGCWIPNGYQKTVAQLDGMRGLVNRRSRLYVDLAGHLGLQTADSFYESHITVEGVDQQVFERFKATCGTMGVKAIHIELPYGAHPSHLITAAFHRGSFNTVKSEVYAMAKVLEQNNLPVTRVKIESMIKNSMVPEQDDEAASRPESEYFEFHTKVITRDDAQLEQLRTLCNKHGAHLSRNASNVLTDGSPLRFATFRVYRQGSLTANRRFDDFLDVLRAAGFSLSNVLREYTIYDTNIRLDDGWFPSARRTWCFAECATLAKGHCPFADRKVSSPDDFTVEATGECPNERTNLS